MGTNIISKGKGEVLFTGITRAEDARNRTTIYLDEITLGGAVMTKDPVCGMNIDENKAKAQTEYQGQKYSFCSEDCRRKFEQNPEQYTSAAA